MNVEDVLDNSVTKKNAKTKTKTFPMIWSLPLLHFIT